METKKVQSYRGRGSDFVFQEPIHTSGLIEIIPSDSIHFYYFEDGLTTASFTISNKTKSIKVFRILTSSFKDYIVTPSLGILSSRDTSISNKQINILMKNQKNIEKRLKDKFLVEALETLMNMNDMKEEELNNINVADVWKEKNSCSVKLQRIIIPISVIYSDKPPDTVWFNNPSLKNSRNKNIEELSPYKPEKIQIKSSPFYNKTDLEYYESEGEIIKKVKASRLTRTHLSVAPAIIESRRNASLYTGSGKTENNFVENYKQKYERLKKKADDQNNELENIRKERDDCLNEINKLKFLYENKVSKVSNYEFLKNLSTIKIWQMLLICVAFLITGSFISFIQT